MLEVMELRNDMELRNEQVRKPLSTVEPDVLSYFYISCVDRGAEGDSA